MSTMRNRKLSALNDIFPALCRINKKGLDFGKICIAWVDQETLQTFIDDLSGDGIYDDCLRLKDLTIIE